MPEALPHESHVIARATFGWSPETERDVLAAGWEAWLDDQLDPDGIADTAVDAMVSGYHALDATNAENHAFAENNPDGEEIITGQLHHAALLRACYSRRQLNEMMVHVWADHFNVWLGDHWLRHVAVVDHREVARAQPFGRFADLLSASAHSPAMLVYLDNYISDATDPAGVNENYGRELLELHTMGLLDGVQPFSEDDVVGVAQVLSGWSVNTSPSAQVFTYKPWQHHTGPVSLFGGTWTTPGRSGAAGYDDGVSLIDHLAHHPATARHVAFRLCRRFVADEPPTSLVDSATAVYLANDTAVGPVIRHIFHSPEFAAAAGAKVRRGFEVFAASVRALGVVIDPDPTGAASHALHGNGWGWLSRLGGRRFSHPAPDGPADTGSEWISSDGMLRRWATAGALTGGWAEGLDFDARAFARPAAPTVDDWITQVAARVLGRVAADPPHPFSDVPPWVDDAVRWITANGYASGYPDNTYRPGDNITRAAVTRMLYRIHAEVVDPLTAGERAAVLALFTDVPATGDDPVPEWLVDWKAHDLVTLLLSIPGFHRR
jgi:uncharacterized protein (DUF1800 family)